MKKFRKVHVKRFRESKSWFISTSEDFSYPEAITDFINKYDITIVSISNLDVADCSSVPCLLFQNNNDKDELVERIEK